ncbi:MAG: two-component sensor histidine kinase [Roseitalea sp.]|jgi:two-component system osmolarity sensor histidine kinase EnvZ|uniref:ATP-binding protein n=1 Tax=Oceaniradius stylonematis TaxID=2184161 RepID=UPI001B0B6E63|nr:two-component sensor histidine kinase [Roseitalea sp.]MBO6952039.1 two-component sensor histidine kinase [Rhizobiaceae bacterium]MBO6592115.1 two-component sensor histidine kinase [Roseitalea sp.]MBO6598370.1 two-component sensor histidine kinase [Roseitalea sp.]MBO6610816.1 two-component sensor histidine kinase [Roseitalea sp.]
MTLAHNDGARAGAPQRRSLRRRLARASRYTALKWRQWISRATLTLPRGLYARSLIIIIAPMVLLQSVIAFVFMERHWQTVTQRLSTAVTRDIAAIIDVIETYPQDQTYAEVTRIARERLALNVAILPPDPLPAPAPKPFFSILDQILSEEITRQIGRPFWIDTVGNSNLVEIRIRMEDKVLRVFARRSQAYASNTHIFLLWMVGTSLVLLFIAILFLRNQIRPIQKLAEAAEGFGKGHALPDSFRPRGAIEVRQASLAFIRMRERIEKQIEQRTEMLAGVSHDLRTILTRFKLQLAMSEPSDDIAAMEKDIDDMQSMLEGYLDFAKGDVEEETGELDLRKALDEIAAQGRLHDREVVVSVLGRRDIVVRPVAFRRLLANIASNAFRHAERLEVVAQVSRGRLTLTMDDNGPGIPEDERDDVFRPFYRIDDARNLDKSGTGLGLSIARDVARKHGGDIVLDDSPLGGLRVTVRLPV